LLVHSSGLWVTARGRLYQFAQIIKQCDIPGREFLPPAASPTNPTRRDIRRRAPQFRQTSPSPEMSSLSGAQSFGSSRSV
jgi:hypothetical protein